MADEKNETAHDPIILDDPEQGYEFSRQKKWREHAKIYIASRFWQLFIIFLIVLDALVVSVDIVIATAYCAEAHPPHKAEITEIVLRIVSIVILSFFVLEWLFEAYVNGFHRFTRSLMHGIDIVVICVSLSLEFVALFLGSALAEIGGLLIMFRLWRVVRVAHAIGDVQHRKHDQEVQELKAENQRLKQLEEAHHNLLLELQRDRKRTA